MDPKGFAMTGLWCMGPDVLGDVKEKMLSVHRLSPLYSLSHLGFDQFIYQITLVLSLHAVSFVGCLL